MEIILNGKQINDKETLFSSLKSQINSSDFYGNNLDALWDVLSSFDAEMKISIINYDDLKNNLGSYAEELFELFEDLKAINDKVIINIARDNFIKNKVCSLPKQRFQEMLHCANNIFFKNETYGFEEFQPKVYLDSDYAKNHYIYEYEGKIVGLLGIYPTDYLGLKLMGIGSVCVDPEYRKQGIMSSLFQYLEEEVESNYDIAYLSGEKFRYQYYGYYKTGSYLSFRFKSRSFKGRDYSKLNLEKYDSQNPETDSLLHTLYKKTGNPVGRKTESYYHVLGTHFSEIYLLDDGYLVYNPYTNAIREIAFGNKDVIEIISSFMQKKELQEIFYEVSLDNPCLNSLEEIASDYTVQVLMNFKVLNYLKVIRQFLKSKENLMPGKLSILVDSKKVLHIEISDNINVFKTDDYKNVDLQLTSKEVHQLLFGDFLKFHPNVIKRELIANWFPFVLPVTLNSIDSF
ncbi:MAG: GNAT family N-acetyltransferase [Bacilli bacterium]|nr:GNAT family N-acetyltransferase [Bacilli bacterium]